MTQQIIRFYELTSAKFQADPLLLVAKLAEKAFETQASCVILATDEEQAMAIDEKLWSYTDDAFLPHQIAGQDDDDECPVLIVVPAFATPIRDVTINLRSVSPKLFGARLLEVIPLDEAEKNIARARFKAFIAADMKPSHEKV